MSFPADQLRGILCMMLLPVAASSAGDGFDWPGMTGPYGSMESKESGKSLIVQISQAKKVWESGFIAAARVDYAGHPGKDGAGGYCTPILWNDRIYLYYFTPRSSGGGEPVTPGIYNGDDNLQCIDAKNGKTLWAKKYVGRAITGYGSKSGPGLSAVVSGGKVFFMGSGAYIYCVDAMTGKTIWEKKSGRLSALYEKIWEGGSDVSFNRVMMSYPAVAGGVVAFNNCLYFKYQYGPGPDRYNYGEANGMVAFDAETGDSLWEVKACLGTTGERGAGKGNAPASWLFDGKEYFIAAGEQKTICADPASGRVVWSLDKGRQQHLSAIVRDSLLLCTGDTTTSLVAYRVDHRGGREIWSLPFDTYGGIEHYPCVSKGRVYILSRKQAKLLALDAATGAVLAQTSHPNGLNFEHDNGFVIACDNRIFTSSGVNSRGIYAWDAISLRQSGWGIPLSPPLSMGYVSRIHPIIVNGFLYARTDDKGIVCYNIEESAAAAHAQSGSQAIRPNSSRIHVCGSNGVPHDMSPALSILGRFVIDDGKTASIRVRAPRR